MGRVAAGHWGTEAQMLLRQTGVVAQILRDTAVKWSGCTISSCNDRSKVRMHQDNVTERVRLCVSQVKGLNYGFEALDARDY